MDGIVQREISVCYRCLTEQSKRTPKSKCKLQQISSFFRDFQQSKSLYYWIYLSVIGIRCAYVRSRQSPNELNKHTHTQTQFHLSGSYSVESCDYSLWSWSTALKWNRAFGNCAQNWQCTPHNNTQLCLLLPIGILFTGYSCQAKYHYNITHVLPPKTSGNATKI